MSSSVPRFTNASALILVFHQPSHGPLRNCGLPTFLSRRKTPWCIAKGWWLLCRQTNRLIAIMTFFMTTANFQPLVLGGWICDDEYYGYHGQEQWAGGRSSKNATSVDDNDKKDRRAATSASSSSPLLLLLDPWEYSFFTFANLT